MGPDKNNKKAIVIGAGFAGLSAAASLAQKGYRVTLLEKNDQTGGRARTFKEKGFLFDMGPSWYWMPDVIEDFFKRFGKKTSDYFELKRLDPSYQVIFENEEIIKLSSEFQSLKNQFEHIEKGSGEKLTTFLDEAKFKYDTGMREFVYKPSVSFFEFADRRILASIFNLDMFTSFSAHAGKFFKEKRLLRIIEFPVLFLGAMPAKTPALYSLMNYADMKLGTWYPLGGMYKLAEAMTLLAKELGVEIHLNESVEKIDVQNGQARRVVTKKSTYEADVVIAGADYNHVEQSLLNKNDRSYSGNYWKNKTMSPSSLLFYIGVSKKLKNILHHNLFFDADFDKHTDAIYTNKRWPEDPLFYVCCPSITDPTVAPEGMENLFVLIPIAAGLEDTEEIRESYFKKVINRIEKICGENITEHIIYKRSYAGSNFISDYNAYKGNAYGLANTLRQTAFLRPSLKSKKVTNLYFTGQLTVPGPGIPPTIISGQVVADYIFKMSKTHNN
jgi:phytoene desaturase